MRGDKNSPWSPDFLEGHRILVTGGGSGLGRVIATEAARHGARVLLWGRRSGVLEEAAAAIAEVCSADSVAYDSVDIRDASAVEAATRRAHADGGPITDVVNSAAANFIAPTESLSAHAFESVTSTVMNGTFNVTNSLGRRWIADGTAGAVVSLVISWAETGSAFAVPSAMAKAAVTAMTKSLAVEWARHRIRLNAVAPGPIPTEFAWNVLDPGDISVVGATSSRGVPAGRYGRPEELANLVLFLLSDGCGYLTGELIVMDGGQRLAGPSTFSELTRLTTEDWTAIRERGKAASAAAKAQRVTD